MAVLLSHLKVPLTWSEVFKRTFREAFWKDNCLGLAAQLDVRKLEGGFGGLTLSP